MALSANLIPLLDCPILLTATLPSLPTGAGLLPRPSANLNFIFYELIRMEQLRSHSQSLSSMKNLRAIPVWSLRLTVVECFYYLQKVNTCYAFIRLIRKEENLSSGPVFLGTIFISLIL